MSNAKPNGRTKKRPVNTGKKQAQSSVVHVPRSAAAAALSPRQQDQLEGHRARVLARPDRPETELIRAESGLVMRAASSQDGGLHGAALFDAFGTASDPFLGNAMQTVCSLIHTEGQPTAEQFNAAVAVVAAVAPENELEATLALQIVGADSAARRCLRMMGKCDFAEQHKMYGDLANKFMRTTTGLVEALAKLRRGGEQVVRHVHVHEGGQAVVADQFHNHPGGGGKANLAAQPHATAIEEGPALLGSDAPGREVSAALNAERAVPDARRA